MELRHLRYFICVAEEMHFGRAAARLGISQPPLSQQIKALEDDLGVRLFERNSRRVHLTASGAMFLPEARAAVLQADKAVQTARRAQSGELGQLGLGFTTSAPFVEEVAGALYAFRQRHPEVEFSLKELPRDEQIALVKDGQLDLGIIRGVDPPALPATLSSMMILEEGIMVALRTDHSLGRQDTPVELGELRDDAFVFYNDSIGAGFNEHFFSLCREAGFSPRVSQEAGSFATLLGLVAAGFGLTAMVQSLSRLHIENVVYRPLAGERAISRLWLIHGQDPSPAAREFLSSVRQRLPARAQRSGLAGD